VSFIDRVPNRVKRATPQPIKKMGRLWLLKFVRDVGSARALASLVLGRRAATQTVEIRLKQLNGKSIWLRPKSSDLEVLWDVFMRQFHLPPIALTHELKCILDLGANIGLSMAHYAALYPSARILGIELDKGNAELARLNTRAWGERSTVVEAAIWPQDGEVSYEIHPGEEEGARVLAGGRTANPGLRTVMARSLNKLLAEYEVDSIDYMKVDIEGTEEQILTSNTEWANRVKCIQVEVHPPYSIKDCVRDLRKLSFETRVDPRNVMSVTGRRR
jgi:FkbM family methyltransferase